MSRFVNAISVFVAVGAIVVIALYSRGGLGAATTTNNAGGTTGNAGAAATPLTAKPAAAAAAAAGDSVNLQPAVAPKELPGCNTYVSSTDGVAETVGLMTSAAKTVAIGTVTDVGAAQWNTPDGAPPASDEDYDAAHVMRLVRLELSQTVKGVGSGAVTVWVQGGKIGCSEFISDRSPQSIAKGDQFAVFLDDLAPASGLKGAGHTLAIWPASAAGIQTPADGVVSAQRFVSLAAASN
jgi:hypothetical protein